MILKEKARVLKARQAFQQEAQAARQAVARQLVLESAGPLFAARGFDGATMSEVASAAGVSLKSLYGVFASKEDLIEAVLALHFGQHVAPLLSQPRQDLPEGARVLEFVDGLLLAMDADRDYLVLVAQGSAGLPAKMRVKGRDPYAQYIDRVEAHLVSLIQDAQRAGHAADLDAQELAVAITASVVALALKSAQADPSRPVSDVSATVRALYGSHLGLRSRRRRVVKGAEEP